MPASTTNFKMVVLWADELRTAAQALERMWKLTEPGAAVSDNDWQAAVRAAIDACSVALNGADDESATLLLSTKPDAVKRLDKPRKGKR